MFVYLFGKMLKHVKAIHEFLPKANVIKISDEELEFITGEADEDKAIQSLFEGSVEAVIYSRCRCKYRFKRWD